MASRNYFFNGIAELLILSILKNNDTYIYGIKKIVDDISNGSLPLSQNTIYAAAYKLEQENKITEYSKLVGRKRTRVYYHIEAEGLIYLDDLLSNYRITTKNVDNLLSFLRSNREENTNE